MTTPDPHAVTLNNHTPVAPNLARFPGETIADRLAASLAGEATVDRDERERAAIASAKRGSK